MSRIAAAFAELKKNGRRGFIPFITAGDPNLNLTRELLVELARAGASIVEVGVPFTDPMADGPVIQRASERALRNEFDLSSIFDMIASAQKDAAVPVVLFSYFNPLFKYGLERLASDARAAGVDGVLVTDLVPEEAEEFSRILRTSNLDTIFLVAPTSTDERLRMIAERASGFIYAVSLAGVTGARSELSRDAEKLVSRVRNFSDLPVAVGFGISSAEQVAEVWKYADAAVVGSAIVAEIEKGQDAPHLVELIGSFVRALIPA